MKWKLTQIGADSAVDFAAEELRRYLKKMDKTAMVTRIRVNTYQPETLNTLYIGCDPAFAALLPAVKDAKRDDAIYIKVENGVGIITGTNPRSVLIAVYRYLRELGCAFLRPGEDGEIIPVCQAEEISISVCEAASYRHRAVCIEGAVSYEHVADIIDWLPKNAMNGYFTQFKKPYEFLNRWYLHTQNKQIPEEPLTDDELDGILALLRGEIAKRGLMYHGVGHSWTCEPFGVPGTGWDVQTKEPPASIAPYLAMLNGKRDWWYGVPLNTNLCYSNPHVRTTIVTAIADYCAENPDMQYVHFWLADGSNNHCECENCTEDPADYYIMMLNELDEILAARGIDTKIVFLIYVDLLWEPKKQEIKNPDRFVLMFAPITRTYSTSFTVPEEDVQEAMQHLQPYEKNHLRMPRSVAENVARLRKWQEHFNGDSFDYDYHIMWDHFQDPGYMTCAKTVSEDMKNLKRLGLGGSNSCQTQRIFYPTSLPILTMAETLWNRDTDFEELTKRYFAKAFGEDGELVQAYMTKLSELFDPPYLRGERPMVDDAEAAKFEQIPGVVADFLPVIERNRKTASDPTIALSWEYLFYHARMCTPYADALYLRAKGRKEDALASFETLAAYLRETEEKTHRVFDLCVFMNKIERKFKQ